MTPTYSGEVQFAGYSDSSRSGPRITLRLSDREDLNQFVGSEGKRYMLALVEIGADEKPVEPQKRTGPLCHWVVMRCKEQQFVNFMAPIYDKVMGGDGLGWGDVHPFRDFGGDTEKWAAHAVKTICGVKSRKDIDGNEKAETLLNAQIRQPYMEWLQRRQAR